MIAMNMMNVAIHNVVTVVVMLNTLMAAINAMGMPIFRWSFNMVFGCSYTQLVLNNFAGSYRIVHMAFVHVVNVVTMLNDGVTAVFTVLVSFMGFMFNVGSRKCD
jgi:hypothetical protein